MGEEVIDATRLEQEEPVMLTDLRNARVARPPRLPYADGQAVRNRPGWPRGSAGGRREQSPRRGPVYCYICYVAGHTAPDCLADARADPSTIVQNYDGLPIAIRKVVPATSYWTARELLDNRVELADKQLEVQPPPRVSEQHHRVLDEPTSGQGKA